MLAAILRSARSCCWIGVVAAATLSHAAPEAQEELYEAAGCRYFIEWVENGVWAAVLGGSRAGLARPGDGMADLLLEAFACERMNPIFQDALASHLASPTRDAASAFFQTDSGRRVALTWAELAFANSAAKIQRYVRLAGPLPPERRAMLERVSHSTQFSKIRWAMMTEPAMGLIRGAARRDGQDPDTTEGYYRDLWSMGIDYLWVDLEISSLTCTAYQYRDLSEAELQVFLQFAESSEGQQFYEGFYRSTVDTLSQVAEFLETQLPVRFPPPPQEGL